MASRFRQLSATFAREPTSHDAAAEDGTLVFGLIGALLLLNLVLPIANLLIHADLPRWIAALRDPRAGDALRISTLTSAITVAIMTLFGVPLGYVLAHGRLPFKQLLISLAEASIGSEVCLGVRAGEILVSASRPAILSDWNVIPGRIKQLERLGPAVTARVGCGAEFRVRMDARSAESCGLDVATEVWMTIGSHACHVVRPVLLDSLRRLFIFVCHGNTVRSPMAQAICNAEIAGRFGVPLESLDKLGIKAVSAGLTARPGEPIAVEAEQALGKIGMAVPEHRSRNLTHRLAHRAEAIFCMTEEQRRELTALFPATQPKSYRLHPEEDLGDPHGKPLDGLLDCALQIQDLVRQRLDGLGVCGAE